MLAGWVAAVQTAGHEGRLEVPLAPGLQQPGDICSDDEAEEEAELAAVQAARLHILQIQRQQLQQVLFRIANPEPGTDLRTHVGGRYCPTYLRFKLHVAALASTDPAGVHRIMW